MKIVILDGHAVNPGDLSWDGLRALGDLTVYERTAKPDILARAENAEIILLNKTKLEADILKQLKACKYIGLMSTGCDAVDLECAKTLGITITNVPAYSTQAVAQMTFAFILHFYSKAAEHDALVKMGNWSRCEDFCFWAGTLSELAGKTIGLIGFGQIGSAVAEIALAFHMRVLTYRRSPVSMNGITQVSIEELLRKSDIVSLHLPYTKETHHLINKNTLSLMKPSAILINTARGLLVDDQALADSLNGGQIAGAALDVLSAEPPAAGHPLLNAKNCIITPHIAWAAFETRERLLKIIIENLTAFLNQTPQNVVG